ncbi:sensor histidine kinase [uncultured Roseibium sp.]|uniref:sensor histidine kinase n=1 Tax=uncultured Roseibium sp. TaxID=1936171 RepID=UPI0032175FF3
MAAALVPLAALAFLFSYSDHLRRAAEEPSQFIDYARLIGQSSAKIMARTEGYAAALATRPEAAFDDCLALFEQVRTELRPAIELNVSSGDRSICSATLRRNVPVMREIGDTAKRSVSILPLSRSNKATGIRVEIGLRPEALLSAPIAATVSSDIGFALLDEDGKIIASHTDGVQEEAEFLEYVHGLELEHQPNQAFFDTDGGWLVAAVTLPGTNFRVLTGARPMDRFLEPWLSLAKALLPPLVLLAVVFVVLRFGIQRFLLRYLRHIYATFRKYGSGDTNARVGLLEAAPAEINILGMTFDMMADQIDHRTKDLEASLVEQQRLTRELHHRIKNTLQMIASLLAMQRRDSKLPEEQAVLRVALERVLSISAAYRVSYASNEGTDVAVEALVREVVETLREPAMVSRSAVRIFADEDAETTIDLDRAIPLAFILAELLPYRFDHLQPGEVIDIHVSGGTSILIRISGGDMEEAVLDEADGKTVLRSRLVRAYLGQLAATCVNEDMVTRLEMPNH